MIDSGVSIIEYEPRDKRIYLTNELFDMYVKE